MYQLIDLLNKTFANKTSENFITAGLWSVGFCERSNTTLFDIYYNKIPVLSGNCQDKTIKLCTSNHIYPYNKLIDFVSVSLPEYRLTGEIYNNINN